MADPSHSAPGATLRRAVRCAGPHPRHAELGVARDHLAGRRRRATAPVTWNTALTCGTYDYAVVPPGTTSITATIYGGGGGGGAGSGTGGTAAGNGGPAGSTTVTYAVTPDSNVGVDIGCGGGAGSTGATAAGGTGASGYAAGGSGGGKGSSGDPGGGGGAGGGATGLCLGTTSGCTTPISIAPRRRWRRCRRREQRQRLRERHGRRRWGRRRYGHDRRRRGRGG